MRRRPAVTLMEVLIAMFIMAIGMLALLALFPVGAVSMAQALKDDRCAYASITAENVAIAFNVRYGDFNVVGPTGAFLNLNPVVGLPNSGLAYVDPYGALTMPVALPFGVPLAGIIPRIYPTFANTLPLADRWFSLPDDMNFYLDGAPDTTGGAIDRGRRYSFAYLLRQQPSPWSMSQSAMKSVQLYAVVYSGRPISSIAPETTLPAAGALGFNNIVINQVGTTLKRGGWILDTSVINPATGQVNGYFYRVTNLVESTLLNTTTIEVQQNLVAPVTQITIMDYVAEVFDKGYGWQQ